jgi:xanthine dehydrogenase iron-sulfur cluster and FAD-binding subunit A
VDGKYGPDVSLNEYIRTVADLRGTKAMCHEGGCGACVVAIRASQPPLNEMKTFSVNSVSNFYQLIIVHSLENEWLNGARWSSRQCARRLHTYH